MVKKLLVRIIGILISLGVGLPLIFFLLVYNGFFGTLPTQAELENIQNIESSLVYDSDQKMLGKYYLQDRTTVPLTKISPFLIDALIATEDKRFYNHSGIDARSLLRVLVKSVLLRESAGGGSTITLQLAKNLFPRRSYSFLYYPINKTREGIIAYRIEQQYSKDEILELYLNTVSFGEDVYGVESAAYRFFNTSAALLKPEQAATLIGMLKATTSYNPALHPEASLARRNVVLSQMLVNEKIEQTEYDVLLGIDLNLDYSRSKAELAPYFLQQVRVKIDAFLTDYNSRTGQNLNLNTHGLKIYTTVNRDMQHYAEEAVDKHMKGLQASFDKHWNSLGMWSKNNKLLDREIKKAANGRSPREMQKPKKIYAYNPDGAAFVELSPIDSIKYYLQQLQAGFVAMNPEDGAINAWVGGIDFQYFPYDHAMEDAKRQVGSTFKPIVYAAALENGVSPCQYFKADQDSYTVDKDEWKPANDNASYDGKYSMEGALEESVNTVSVKILNAVGIEKTIALAHDMGISSAIPEVLSIALGTPSISLVEMVTAYSSFVNGGFAVSPYTIERIEDRDGNILYQHQNSSKKRVLSRKSSRLMVHLLEGVVDDGTARSLRTVYGLNNAIGGKTGTTQGNADGWFIAITPQLVSGAWVGGIYPEISFQETRLGQGATMALPIFAKFYGRLSADQGYKPITKAEFPVISEEWKNELDCDPFKEDFRLFDWLFNKEDKGEKISADKKKEGEEGFFRKIGDIFKKKNKKEKQD